MQELKWFKQQKTGGNAAAVLKNLTHHLNVKVTDHTIGETLKVHPNYPSLLALSDALTEWNVKNTGFEATMEALTGDEMTFPAIACLRNRVFVMITKIRGETIRYLDTARGWIEESLEEFQEKWDGHVLLAKAAENAGERHYEENRRKDVMGRLSTPLTTAVLAAVGVLPFISGFSLHSESVLTWLPLLSAKIAGLVFCILLIIAQMNKYNPFVMRICGFNASSSCHDVTESPAGMFFGLVHMSELGFFYFAGGFLTLSLSLFSADMRLVFLFLGALNLLTLPYTLFSLWYQKRIVQRWCPLCIGVVATFWVEFAVSLMMFGLEIPAVDFSAVNFAGISPILPGFLLPMVAWTLHKPKLELARMTKGLKSALGRFKGNYEIFDFLINQEEAVDVEPMKGDIVLGHHGGRVNIMMVASAFCGFCVTAYKEFETIISEFEEDVRIIIRFLDGGKRDVSKHFAALGLSGETELAQKAVHSWYFQKNKDPEKWIKEFPVPNPPDSETIEALMDEMFKWCVENMVLGTPAFFINSRKKPAAFQISEIKYYLRDLFEKMEEAEETEE